MSNITYRQAGDYLIPNINLAEEDKQPVGKYGMMRKDYLFNNKRVYFDVFSQHGGTCSIDSNLPAWDYAEVSPRRDQILQSYQNVSQRSAVVAITHGGLEYGIFAGASPNIDIVSIGATIADAHSVDETLDVQSVKEVYSVVTDTLKMSK